MQLCRKRSLLLATMIMVLLAGAAYAQANRSENRLPPLPALPTAEQVYLQNEETFPELPALSNELAPGNDETAMAGWQDLGSYYFRQGRYREAEQIYQYLLTITERQLNNRQAVTILNSLGKISMVQKRFAEAERYYTRALSISETEGDVALLVAQLYNTAEATYVQGRYADATLFFQRILAIYEQHHHENHPDIARILNNLAALYFYQQKFVDAQLLLQRALLIYERAYGPHSPHSRRAAKNYQRLLHTMRSGARRRRYIFSGMQLMK